jgi:hypothetical protein
MRSRAALKHFGVSTGDAGLAPVHSQCQCSVFKKMNNSFNPSQLIILNCFPKVPRPQTSRGPSFSAWITSRSTLGHKLLLFHQCIKNIWPMWFSGQRNKIFLPRWLKVCSYNCRKDKIFSVICKETCKTKSVIHLLFLMTLCRMENVTHGPVDPFFPKAHHKRTILSRL